MNHKRSVAEAPISGDTLYEVSLKAAMQKGLTLEQARDEFMKEIGTTGREHIKGVKLAYEKLKAEQEKK